MRGCWNLREKGRDFWKSRKGVKNKTEDVEGEAEERGRPGTCHVQQKNCPCEELNARNTHLIRKATHSL